MSKKVVRVNHCLRAPSSRAKKKSFLRLPSLFPRVLLRRRQVHGRPSSLQRLPKTPASKVYLQGRDHTNGLVHLLLASSVKPFYRARLAAFRSSIFTVMLKPLIPTSNLATTRGVTRSDTIYLSTKCLRPSLALKSFLLVRAVFGLFTRMKSATGQRRTSLSKISLLVTLITTCVVRRCMRDKRKRTLWRRPRGKGGCMYPKRERREESKC